MTSGSALSICCRAKRATRALRQRTIGCSWKRCCGLHAPALGRSRGGLSTKIHATIDALGNPLRSYLTWGEVADIKQTPALIEGLRTQAVLADKAYDADALLARIAAQGAAAVIPPMAHCHSL